jgi:hypothetical protein
MAYPLNLVRPAIVTASLAAALSAGLPQPASARRRPWIRSPWQAWPQFAGDRRHSNDEYVKAASDDRDQLLKTKIKSICRGC